MTSERCNGHDDIGNVAQSGMLHYFEIWGERLGRLLIVLVFTCLSAFRLRLVADGEWG